MITRGSIVAMSLSAAACITYKFCKRFRSNASTESDPVALEVEQEDDEDDDLTLEQWRRGETALLKWRKFSSQRKGRRAWAKNDNKNGSRYIVAFVRDPYEEGFEEAYNLKKSYPPPNLLAMLCGENCRINRACLLDPGIVFTVGDFMVMPHPNLFDFGDWIKAPQNIKDDPRGAGWIAWFIHPALQQETLFQENVRETWSKSQDSHREFRSISTTGLKVASGNSKIVLNSKSSGEMVDESCIRYLWSCRELSKKDLDALKSLDAEIDSHLVSRYGLSSNDLQNVDKFFNWPNTFRYATLHMHIRYGRAGTWSDNKLSGDRYVPLKTVISNLESQPHDDAKFKPIFPFVFGWGFPGPYDYFPGKVDWEGPLTNEDVSAHFASRSQSIKEQSS